MEINKLKLLSFYVAKFLVLFLFGTPIYPAKVTISDRKLLVDDHEFIIKGVCYSPTPVGEPAGYDWSKNPDIYKNDFPLIRAMGANTIRTFSPPTQKEALDELYNNGLYIIMGYWVNPGQDFSSATVRNIEKTNFLNMVNQWKNHPAVLMWCFGNEVYPGGSGADAEKWSAWYSLVNEVAQEAKNIDSSHPVTTINSDIWTIGIQQYGSSDSSMTALDCWGMNLYLGKDFKDRFTKYKSTSTKPLLISEFGCDAYNKLQEKEDQKTQAEYIKSQWQNIEENLFTKNGVCIGGVVFEWSDEWWKSKVSTQSNSYHETSTDWTNNNYSDTSINEEWWGITSISPQTYEKTPRQAYYELAELWSGQGIEEKPSGKELFATEPKNYPNPSKPGQITKIKFKLTSDNAEIKSEIYDQSGNKICELSTPSKPKRYTYELQWDGKNSNGDEVNSGLYICRIEAKDPEGYSDTKFRKILILR